MSIFLRTKGRLLFAVVAVSVACGDSGGSEGESGSESESTSSTTSSTTTSSTTTTTTTSASTTAVDSSGSEATTSPETTASDSGGPPTCENVGELGCTMDVAGTCACYGCNAECFNGPQDIVSDCVCPVCAEDPFCNQPDSCTDDGLCDPFPEGCQCADCAGHPSCA